MKWHFNNISQIGDNYIYEYHIKLVNSNSPKTFGYFAIAGVIGSIRVVGEKGWLYLIPFWLAVFLTSKFSDWFINKWGSADLSVQLIFLSKYPHYTAEDIIWMIKCTNNRDVVERLIEGSDDDYGEEVDVEIGKITVRRVKSANFTKRILNQAIGRQFELQGEWSSRTGLKYPDLGMPKRKLFNYED